MTEKTNLDLLKEDYKKISEENSLPSFDELNKDFQIEKLQDQETDFLVREVRKFMFEKFTNYFRFIESLIQPSNAQMFIYSMLKVISQEEKDKLVEIYKELSRKEIEVIELDLDLSEEKEINFIKESYDMWKKIKVDLLEIIKKIKMNWDYKQNGYSERNYFG